MAMSELFYLSKRKVSPRNSPSNRPASKFKQSQAASLTRTSSPSFTMCGLEQKWPRLFTIRTAALSNWLCSATKMRLNCGREISKGRDRLFLTKSFLVFDRDNIRLSSTNTADLNVAIYPATSSIASDHGHLAQKSEGIFQSYDAPAQSGMKFRAQLEKVQAAGPLREIPIGKIERPVAMAPLDADFRGRR